jgi:hypothetical protein
MFDLSPEEIEKRQNLTQKLKHGTLTREDGQVLKAILEKEQTQAKNINDLIGLGAILFLLGAVIAFLSEDEGKKKRKKK